MKTATKKARSRTRVTNNRLKKSKVSDLAPRRKLKKKTTKAAAKKATKAKKKAASSNGSAGSTGVIEIERLTDAVLVVPIVGLTPYIPHKWSEKAKRAMPGHPDADSIKSTREKRNPKGEADACLYTLGKKLAIPATAFKAAAVGACRYFDKPSMVECKQLLSIQGHGPEQLVPIEGSKTLREDTPRNANGNADLRYRYAISDWSCEIRVRYTPARISAKSILALLDAAGRGGVGDWRPSAPKSCTGTFGTFRVDFSAAIYEEEDRSYG